MEKEIAEMEEIEKYLPKDLSSIIFKMKTELEDTERNEKKLFSIVHNSTISHIFPSLKMYQKNGSKYYGPCNHIKSEKIGHQIHADIPFHDRYFTLLFFGYIKQVGDVSFEYIYINLNVDNRFCPKSYYTVEDLAKIIESFYFIPNLNRIVVDSWDKVCDTDPERSYPILYDELKKFVQYLVNKRKDCSIRCYMSKENYERYHFEQLNGMSPLVKFTYQDNVWD
jgi:hypothetical protein